MVCVLEVEKRANGGDDGDMSTSGPRAYSVDHDGYPNHNSVGRALQREAPWGSVMNGWGRVAKVVRMLQMLYARESQLCKDLATYGRGRRRIVCSTTRRGFGLPYWPYK